MRLKRISEDNIKLIHLNTNMGIKGIRDSYVRSFFGNLYFFLSRQKSTIYINSDIENIVSKIIKNGGDILGFSEIFGIKQVNIVTRILEKAQYKVYKTDAFELWSQNEEKECLYNIIGVKESSFDGKSSILNIIPIRNKRRIIGLVIALIYFLRGLKNISLETFKKSYLLYKRLAAGILDGVIMTIELGNGLRYSHLHIHSDNPNINTYFSKSIYKKVPHVMIGDFNIRNIDKFLIKNPEYGDNYKSFLPNNSKTFSFSKGLSGFGKIIHKTPDNVIGNRFIENIDTYTINSLSDHQGLVSIIRINNFDFKQK